jgi:hypothetical protein
VGGCLAPPALPPELAALALTKVNSPKVTLWTVRLERKDGRFLLSGHAFRHYPAAGEDTSRTHLVITLFDAAGKRLRELPADFAPRQIPHGYRGPGYSVFSIPLEQLPADTYCIQVRAVDADTPAPTHSDR